MSDIEILEYVAGGRMLKDMSAIEFMGWIAGKLNNVTINPIVQELRMLVSAPPMTNRLAPESKILAVRKMLEAGIKI